MRLSKKARPRLLIAGSATAIALAAAFQAHGSYWLLQPAAAVIGISAIGLFLTNMAVWFIRRRPSRLQRVLDVATLSTAFSLLALIPAARIAFLVDRLACERFVAGELGPHLESVKDTTAIYPPTLSAAGVDPLSGPWLLRAAQYEAQSASYTLTYNDPLICSNQFRFDSSLKKWSRHHSMCWY